MKKHINLPILKNTYLKVISKNYVIIENYHDIINISKTEVVSTDYIIKGEGLIVKKIDGFYIEIKGQIKTIDII